MEKRMTKVINTKMYAEGDAIQTTLTLDFSGLSIDDIYEVAAKAAVVTWQSNARSKKSIPTVAEYKVPKPGTRSVATLDHAAALVKAIGADMAYKAMQKFGSAEAACEALKALVDMDMDNE